VDRSTIVAAQRDALWVIALRTKLLHAQSARHFHASRLVADARDTLARARRLERVFRLTGGPARRRRVVSLVSRRETPQG